MIPFFHYQIPESPFMGYINISTRMTIQCLGITSTISHNRSGTHAKFSIFDMFSLVHRSRSLPNGSKVQLFVAHFLDVQYLFRPLLSLILRYLRTDKQPEYEIDPHS